MPEPAAGFGRGLAISAAGLLLNAVLILLRAQLPQALLMPLFAVGAVLAVIGLVIQLRAVGGRG